MTTKGEVEYLREREKREKDAKRSEVLEMISTDMQNDAAAFDGHPFDGKTIAEYFGNQGAAISALAKIIKSILEQIEKVDGK